MNRRDIKDRHESSVLLYFKKYLQNINKQLEIHERPDPPDALVSIDRNKTWIEITDAFLNGEFARTLTSLSTEDIDDYAPAENPFIIIPDELFSDKVLEVISKKYQKKTMSAIYKKYGPGVLLVGLYSPYMEQDEINDLREQVAEFRQRNDDRFEQIYLYDPSHRFYQVP